VELRKSSLENLVMDATFWKGKKVLITGHTGFKGSWLSLWLHHLGAHLIGYALDPPTVPSLFKNANIADHMISRIGDIRDLKKLQSVFNEYQPEIVIHMAAQSLVRYSYQHPVETYVTNLIGTANVLEAVRQTKGTKAVLIITSDKCYANQEWVWGYRETEPMGGYDPYSSSKGCAELVTAAYQESFFPKDKFNKHRVAVASARAGNVIGGGDWAQDRLVPDMMRAIQAGKVIRIRSPKAVRPWQHVVEPLHGYMCLIEKLWENANDYSGPWNFGPNDADCRTVLWLVEALNKLWTRPVKFEIDDTDHPHEASMLKLDCSKAKWVLGWSPVLDLDTALEWVAEWYQHYQNNKDVFEVTSNQISRFESLIT
jgi:CDP-glucose 4,6-dehydratase